MFVSDVCGYDEFDEDFSLSSGGKGNLMGRSVFLNRDKDPVVEKIVPLMTVFKNIEEAEAICEVNDKYGNSAKFGVRFKFRSPDRDSDQETQEVEHRGDPDSRDRDSENK